MNCPKCGTAGCYIGLVAVECTNQLCQFYVAPAVTEASPGEQPPSEYDEPVAR